MGVWQNLAILNVGDDSSMVKSMIWEELDFVAKADKVVAFAAQKHSIDKRMHKVGGYRDRIDLSCSQTVKIDE